MVGAVVYLESASERMPPADRNTFLQNVENNWRQLIDDRNTLGEQFPKSFCAYETLSISGIPIVDRTAAQTWCDAAMQGMAFNHVDIVKPTQRNGDFRYDWTRARILQTVKATGFDQASTVCSQNFMSLGEQDTGILVCASQSLSMAAARKHLVKCLDC